jgi:hypothetical protein
MQSLCNRNKTTLQYISSVLLIENQLGISNVSVLNKQPHDYVVLHLNKDISILRCTGKKYFILEVAKCIKG